jgi:hypothetical protein
MISDVRTVERNPHEIHTFPAQSHTRIYIRTDGIAAENVPL